MIKCEFCSESLGCFEVSQEPGQKQSGFRVKKWKKKKKLCWWIKKWKGRSSQNSCYDFENQFVNCPKRHTPTILPLCNVEETSGSCLPARGQHGVSLQTQPGPPSLSPYPTAEWLESPLRSLRLKLGLLYLNPEHLLKQVTLWVLVLTFCFEATRQQWSRPKPVWMVSQGGKPIDLGWVPKDPAIPQIPGVHMWYFTVDT